MSGKKLSLPGALAALLLTTHAALLLYGIRCHFVTVDEVNHIAAGLSYWETGSFRAYRVNPPLTKALAVIPVLLFSPEAKSVGLRENPDLHDIVVLARLTGIAWSLFGGWLIRRWASELYGEWAGCLGLTLWCLGPNILAHAQLMTPDVPAAVAGLAATYVFRHYLQNPSWERAWWAGVVLGLAQQTKYTLLVLYPVWLVLGLLHHFTTVATNRVPLRSELAHAVLLLLSSLFLLNLGYGFEGTGQPLKSYTFRSAFFRGEPTRTGEDPRPGNRFAVTGLGALPVPVPENYLYGIDDQRAGIEARRPSYLAGEWSRQGWWYYYLYALAVKVPLGVLGLGLWATARTIARRGAPWLEEMTLWLPALLFLVFVSSQTGINRHLRYLLPIFPLLVVLFSKVAQVFTEGSWKLSLAAGGLITWSCVSSLSLTPHWLSYFNELAGGPDRGHAHLVDSNIDWGQDLLFLRDWVQKHPEARPLGLAYFHIVDPKVIGLQYFLPPRGLRDGLPEPDRGATIGPGPGTFAVSVNLLRGLVFHAPDGQGGWQLVDRQDYAYFHHFEPVAKAGYSIFIYSITWKQANEVREQLGWPLLPRPRD